MDSMLTNALNLVLKNKIDFNDLRVYDKKPRNLMCFPLYEHVFKAGEKKTLFEGLIKTYSIESAKRHFIHVFQISPEQFRIIEDHGVSYAEIYIPDVGDNRRIIERGMDLYGYYLSDVTDKGEYIVMQFEPKFQNNANEEVRKNKYLFHVTPSFNVDKIKAKGLCPRSKNQSTYFPDRVYFLSGMIGDFFVGDMAKALKAQDSRPYNDGRYTVLRIDVENLPENIDFMKDTATEGGIAFWTYNNIPPQCIEVYREIKIEE